MGTQVYFGQNVVFDCMDATKSIVGVGDEIYVLRKAASVTDVMVKAGA